MDSVETKIREIISKIIKVQTDRIANDDDLVDKHGMDSLSRVEVLTELEKEFDITIDDAISLQMRSVVKYLEIVKGQLSRK